MTPKLSKSTQKNTSTIDEDALAFDRDHIWHPYTSLTNPLHVYPVVSAKGTRIQLSNGKELIDGMASWWSAIHGYNHPILNSAAKTQLDKMSHIMFGGLTHLPAIDLCKKLVELTPDSLNRVFLCDSGSVSVEVGMKMAIQYQQALGKTNKSNFLTIMKGYHGDTTGAMSVCDPVSGMHHLFSNFMPKHCFMDAPQKSFNATCNNDDVQKIELFFERNAKDAVAFILEPIVQGAGGMRFYSPDYLKIIRRLCDDYGLLMIADEIATGFGRTGKMFAVNHADVIPDIMNVGKALTGGYLTLAATICTSKVANTICNGQAGVMMHGPTFMGNPLACAIATSSLDLLVNSPWQERIASIETLINFKLNKLIGSKFVRDVRVLGGIGVIETKELIDVQKAQAFFVEQGIWIRPFRNLLYIMPPYTIHPKDLEKLCEVMITAIQMEELYV
ncbi:MAG: adenosylmethionine--8-amino-7-oxononanoate transaminase [Saprospiraceae bacterium]|nr:adenosylmethionine--8-amino-7-oxononanoate transaminase [Saprospiraceae bacterium]